MDMRKKIVVLGSNSFSGSHFVCSSLEAGMVVMGISRSREPHPVFLPYKNHDYSNFEFNQLDINLDLDQIMIRIRDFQPDYVVNFAAQGMVAESWLYPEHWFQTNVVAMVKLHERLRKLDFLQKYVHVSTPEVYGSCEGMVREGTYYRPSTPYAASRAAADMSLMTFYNAYEFPVVFTRASNVYGPGQQLYRIIPRTILFALLGKKLKLHGGGYSVRSFIHIRDVAAGTLQIAEKAKPGQIYHLSTNQVISIRELVMMILQQMGLLYEDHVEISDDRLGKDAAYLLDSSKADRELNWTAKVQLEQGIEETIGWVRNNLEVLRRQPFDYIHKP